MAMQICAMGRVSGILVALQPVAIQLGDADLPQSVGKDQQTPRWQQGSGSRTHVRPDQTAQLLNWVSSNLDIVLKCASRGFHRSIGALSSAIKLPSVVATTETVLVRKAIFQLGHAVRTEFPNQAQISVLSSKEHQVFA